MNNYNLNKYNLMNDNVESKIRTSDIKCGIRIATERRCSQRSNDADIVTWSPSKDRIPDDRKNKKE
ncbi:hypothetical protein PIROE2DRAFT_8319 [Piromyces sp. E2]|nr:hypothetical protein PIROE2DRAFT_8319 [Piromyces sp. E2]|eukprot:OUM64783.1 hypothetical protein PIROE2DRAFT_8319 [Piromyces sp. E2]